MISNSAMRMVSKPQTDQKQHTRRLSSSKFFAAAAYVTAYSLLEPHLLVSAGPTTPACPAHLEDITERPCADFKMVAGNLNKAEVLFLGELHHRKDKTERCLLELNKKNHQYTVLHEGIPANMKVPCKEIKSAQEAPGRTCIGWDTQKHMERMIAERGRKELNNLLFEVQNALKLKGALESEGKITDEALTKHLSDIKSALKYVVKSKSVPSALLQHLDVDSSTDLNLYVSLLKWKIVFDAILCFRKQGISYDQILNGNPVNVLEIYIQQASPFSPKELPKLERERTESLLEVANKQSKFPNPITAIAGLAHYVHVTVMGEESSLKTESRFLQEKLRQGFLTKEHAILVPTKD